MSPKSRLARYGLWSVGFSREQFAQLAAAGRVEKFWIEDAVGLAVVAEELGFGSLWLGGLSADLKVAESALAATKDLTVATGVINIWQCPVDEVAASFHRLEAAYPGRFLLGIGSGHREFGNDEGPGRAGPPPTRSPLQALADYLDRLDTAGVPQSRRVISALGPRMLHLAAQRSAGAHPFDTTPDHTQQARQLVGPDALITPIQGVAISTDTDYARALGRQALQLQLPLANYRNLFKRLGFTDEDIAAPGSDRLVDALVAQGSIPQVAGRLDAHLAAGANQVSIQVVNDAPEVVDLVRELAAHLAK